MAEKNMKKINTSRNKKKGVGIIASNFCSPLIDSGPRRRRFEYRTRSRARIAANQTPACRRVGRPPCPARSESRASQGQVEPSEARSRNRAPQNNFTKNKTKSSLPNSRQVVIAFTHKNITIPPEIVSVKFCIYINIFLKLIFFEEFSANWASSWTRARAK